MASCENCKYFTPLSPGYAAICLAKWTGLKWNDAVPLTSRDEWCEDHEPKK